MSLASGLHSSQDTSDIVVWQVDKIIESKVRAVEAVKEGLSHAPDHPGLLGLSAHAAAPAVIVPQEGVPPAAQRAIWEWKG